jgi:hypothetical protein
MWLYVGIFEYLEYIDSVYYSLDLNIQYFRQFIWYTLYYILIIKCILYTLYIHKYSVFLKNVNNNGTIPIIIY